jgi:hypothetical protein
LKRANLRRKWSAIRKKLRQGPLRDAYNRFVSKAGKHIFTHWDHDKKHRDHVLRKVERIQGLVALLDTWENKPQDNDEYRKYLGKLRRKLRSARTQYQAMAI